MNSRTPFILSHFLVAISAIFLLLSGFRIASLQHDFWLQLNWLLPQGLVHLWHVLAAAVMLLALPAMLYFLYQKRGEKGFLKDWNLLGSILLVLSSCTGLLQTFSSDIPAIIQWLHYQFAIGLLIFFLLHPVRYYLTKPLRFLMLYSVKPFMQKRTYVVLAGIVLWSAGVSAYLLSKPLILDVMTIDDGLFVRIDGRDDEVAWQTADALEVGTFGGANFYQGATQVSVRALHNQTEMYFFIRWQDPTESIQHLPLYKDENGWKVKEQGYSYADEKRYYEDKFAILLSQSCYIAAAGTAHLGKKPLADKPANLHGKGFHYSNTNIADLWHWKAVRTNNMYIMDDNHIGLPAKPIEGIKRYSAGYRQDSSLGGSYKMNWKWYSPTGVEPKRLPMNPKGYIKDNANGYQSWFDYKAYRAENDTLPVGSILPSVLYRSNQMEGSRADVRARAEYNAGYWNLEVVRQKAAKDDMDINLQDGLCMWVSAFDHAQVAHTRHVRPMQLRYVTERGQ